MPQRSPAAIRGSSPAGGAGVTLDFTCLCVAAAGRCPCSRLHPARCPPSFGDQSQKVRQHQSQDDVGYRDLRSEQRERQYHRGGVDDGCRGREGHHGPESHAGAVQADGKRNDPAAADRKNGTEQDGPQQGDLALAVQQFAEAARWQELVHQTADDKAGDYPEGRLAGNLPDGRCELLPRCAHCGSLPMHHLDHFQALRNPGLLGLELQHEIGGTGDDKSCLAVCG